MAVFYCKYHLLSAEERRAIVGELKDTHQSFVNTRQLIQQHVNIIKWRMEELSGHYEVWIADEQVAGKKWRLHPREELKRLLSDTENVTDKMDKLIRQGDTRRRSSGSWCDPGESSRKNSFNFSTHLLLPEKKK
jgi:hypothetical protein